MTAAAPYVVMVDENFHYADRELRWRRGEYATAEEAVAECKRMVDADLRGLFKPGMSAVGLMERYRMFGDDPFIVPQDGAPTVEFSAWDYAEERCVTVCG